MSRAIASDEVAAGDGALRTCSARPVCEMTKSSTSAPSRADGLRADAARAGQDVGRLELRDVALRGADEGGPVRGVAHLATGPSATSASPSATSRATRASPRGRRGGRAAGGRRRGRRAMSAVGPTSTSPSMWRVRWTPRNGSDGSGHRVDQRADEVAPLGPQPQVGAAERDDARVGGRARGDREAVRPGAGAEDGVARRDVAVACAAPPRARRLSTAVTAQPSVTRPPRSITSPAARGRRRGSRRSGRRRVQRGDARRVRLELAQLRGVEAAQARHAVRRARAVRARRGAGSSAR